MIDISKLSANKILRYFIPLYISWGMIIGILVNITNLFNLTEAEFIIGIFNKTVYLLFFLVSFLFLIKLKRYLTINIIILTGWGILFLFSCIVTPQVLDLFRQATFYFIANVFIPVLLFSQIKLKDINAVEKNLGKYIYFSVIYAVLELLVYEKYGNYDMGFSYSILVPTLLCFILMFKGKKILYCIFLSILIIANLKCGSRGSLLCYAIFILYFFVLNKIRYKSVIAVLSICVLSVFLINFNSILNFVGSLLGDSRTLSLFTDGNLFYLSGREKYYEYVWHQFLDSPLDVKGIYSDRIYLSDFFGRSMINEIWGSYAHNIFLELLFQFRIYAIPIICVFFIVVVCSFNKIKKIKCDGLENLYCIFSAYCIGQLIFSSSYLSAPSFGWFIGISLFLCLHIREYKNEYKNN